MPEGVEVVVEDGFATIEFVDPALRGPGLAKLLEIGGPEMVEKQTRPRVSYRVPEGNARAAGLLDDGDFDPAAVDDPADPVVKTWPDGDPSDDWRRDELDDYALAVHSLDTTDLPNKSAVLEAIEAT